MAKVSKKEIKQKIAARLEKIAKHEGLASLFTVRAEETLLHACLLFSWALFVREGTGVLLIPFPTTYPMIRLPHVEPTNT